MTQSERKGYAIGALFMTGFGAVWALAAVSAASGSTLQLVIAFAAVAAITIALLALALGLRRVADQLPEDDPARQAEAQRRERLFNLVFLTQGVAIGITVAVCVSTERSEYIPPVIAMIVGAHFLPLASLFRMPLYYATGALLILIPLVVLFAMPESREIGGSSVWMVIPMVGSAVVLWLTAAGVVRAGRSALSGAS